MRPTLLIAVLAAALTGTALAAVRTIAKPTPAGTLKAEIAAFNARNFAAEYSAYTARYKARCPYAEFRKTNAAQRAQLPPGLTLRVKVTSVRTAGAKAYLAYSISLPGVGVVDRTKDDLYVRVRGLWYDEVDPGQKSAC